jgi:hypothetical protein
MSCDMTFGNAQPVPHYPNMAAAVVVRPTCRPEPGSLVRADRGSQYTSWVFALGDPFAGLSWYESILGSVVMVLFSLLVALIASPDPAS